jgi:hypothetical protein
MIINIEQGTFGGRLKAGDLVGVCNIVEYIRKIKNNQDIQFHIKSDAIHDDDYCRKFYSFLVDNTNYLVSNAGSEFLNWRKVNLWDFRDISGDLVKIPNNKTKEKKIGIFKLTNYPYKVYRNWPNNMLQSLIERYSSEQYKDYEKIVCSKNDVILTNDGWKVSKDYMENINHIMTTEIFVGGDTGTTHLAFALDKGPKEMLYLNSSRALVHTLPFYLMQGKGKMETYWLDFEGTSWA